MKRKIKFEKNQDIQSLFGPYDKNLKLIEQGLNIHVKPIDEGLCIIGDLEQIDKACELFDYLLNLIDTEGLVVKYRDIQHALKLAQPKDRVDFKALVKEKIDVSIKGTVVVPKTKGQGIYVEAIKHNDIVFGIGPAGTGKTYLAMAMAVSAFEKGLVRRIILTRPAIEAGEHLGFLPGDLVEKVSPYLRPLYDALYEMMVAEKVDILIEKGVIEVAPLAFMRGRTLNDAFIVLDEAQNCTPFQMKMFLTRLGFDSKTVITGDLTQSDLPKGEINGLFEAEKIVKGVDGIEFIHLSSEDVVRHELVQRIIEAYDNANQNR